MSEPLAEHIAGYLSELTAYPDRHVGGPGNLAATAFFAETVARLGFEVRRSTFACIEWERHDAVLAAGDERFDVRVGPYSLPCDVTAPLVAVTCVEGLESDAIRGAIVLLHGEIARSQVMPKNFRFYNPASHQRIIRALERYAPAAVIAATGRDPQMVGGQYPFPLFEDGDLDVPNAYMTDTEGGRLLACVSESASVVSLCLDSGRILASAEHVVATLPGDLPGRIVVSAHIDSREGSPGALDNASGVAVLLGVAELLAADRHRSGPTIEIMPFNGEDNYANPGEILWVEENDGRFDDIILGINVDDLGMRDSLNHVSLYGCPPDIAETVRRLIAGSPHFAEGPQWFQGDHSILGLYGRPAIALASSEIASFMANYAHTERDTLDLADSRLIVEAAWFVRDVVNGVGEALAVQRG
ncbi:MAG: M28 family peptidase [Coriobacteriia bacterium]|nr:M28 family peptidase [Coriobacteriia bacterium]